MTLTAQYHHTCVYNAIVISDHGPVAFIDNELKPARGVRRWRFHSKRLNDPSTLKFVESQVKYYFDNKYEALASTRLQAFVALICGLIISYTSSITNDTHLEM